MLLELSKRIYRRASDGTLIWRSRKLAQALVLPSRVGAQLFRLLSLRKPGFVCPLCDYRGPFVDSIPLHGRRNCHAACPACGANRRIRLQYLVLQRLARELPLHEFDIYHFSPEREITEYLRQQAGRYRTAGLPAGSVEFPADLTALPFPDGSCDLIYASHILEHIPNDRQAIREIRRVLTPRGVAVLPVPIVQEETVEYPEPNPHEAMHVRAPGLDYFERYAEAFPRVDIFCSTDFDDQHQLWNYEDRSHYPTPESPLKRPMVGVRHLDYVPVCYASA